MEIYFDFMISYSLSFDHQIVFWEQDSDEPFGGDDDDLFSVVVLHTNADSTVERFTLGESAIADELDTRLGGEQIWAEIYARNVTTGGQVISRKSPILNLAV